MKAEYQCESKTYSSCQSRCLVLVRMLSFIVIACLHVYQNVGLHFCSIHILLVNSFHESDVIKGHVAVSLY